MALNGTYDVLTIPLLLPKTTVQSLLPASLGELEPSVLLPIPSSTLSALDLSTTSPSSAEDEVEEQHLILLQLGYQSGAGPSFIGMSFEEAKLEIPYVRHPKCTQLDRSFIFKQKCIFSNRMISTSANYLTGLNSSLTSFTPSTSPWLYPADEDSLEYKADGYVEASAKVIKADSESESEREREKRWKGTGAEMIKRLSEEWWFGDRTGNTISKFDFDDPSIGPTPYDVTVSLNLGAFNHDGGNTYVKETFKGVGIRSRAYYVAKEERL